MTVAATGFFDGVHLGHKKVIGKVCHLAKAQGVKSQIITFWPHPRSVLQQEAYNLRLLTTLEEKKALFKAIGVNKVTVLEFTKQFSHLSTEEFIEQYLKKKCGVTTLVIGYDHKIGHNPNESQADMIATCRAHGLKVVRVEEFIFSQEIVSSTKIRRLLEQGDIALANSYLGYRYSLKGVVVSGNRLGRTIGYPTANLKLYEPLKLVPAKGVYAVYAEVNKKTYKGFCNIGLRPTVGQNSELTIETNIFDFDEDIYGLDLKLRFVARLRDERKFAGLEALKAQLASDKLTALSIV